MHGYSATHEKTDDFYGEDANAAAIEAAGEDNIIGTLAGDDTLLVLYATAEEAAAFCEKLNLDYIKG